VCWAGGEAELGQLGPACARGRKKVDGLKVRGLWRGGEGNWAGWRKRERGEGERDFFFFSNSFHIRFSNFQTSIKQETMHSNHDAQALIIYNLFK
jgi:hypothetical protein